MRTRSELEYALKVLADTNRLALLRLVFEAGLGGARTMTLHDRLGCLSQPTVSHHLSVLAQAGFVTRRSVYEPNRHVYWVAAPAAVSAVLAEVAAVVGR